MRNEIKKEITSQDAERVIGMKKETDQQKVVVRILMGHEQNQVQQIRTVLMKELNGRDQEEIRN